MKRYRFAYNEPRLGDIEIEDDDNPSTQWTEEDIIRVIEENYPEAIDIELLEFEQLNG
jgi:hypothetical protein